jgi:hypothetical protein
MKSIAARKGELNLDHLPGHGRTEGSRTEEEGEDDSSSDDTSGDDTDDSSSDDADDISSYDVDDTPTNETQLDTPPVTSTGVVHDGWEQLRTENGSIYYENTKTNETQWDAPPGFPPGVVHDGWEQLRTENGSIYYENATTNETQWDAPPGFPPGVVDDTAGGDSGNTKNGGGDNGRTQSARGPLDLTMTSYQKMYLLYKFSDDRMKPVLNKQKLVKKSPVDNDVVDKKDFKSLIKQVIVFMKDKRTKRLPFLKTPIEPLFYAIRHYKQSIGETYTISNHMDYMRDYHNCDSMVYVPFVLNKGSTRANGINAKGFVKADTSIGVLIQNAKHNESMLIKLLKANYDTEWNAYLTYLPTLFTVKTQMNTSVPGYKVADVEFKRHYQTAHRQGKGKLNKDFIIYLVNFKRWKFNKSNTLDC